MRKQTKKQTISALARAADFPQDAFGGAACIHVTDGEDVLVESCRGVLACTEDKMVFDMGRFRLSVVGRALVLRELSKDGTLRIDGRVSGLLFDGKEAD
ncbi:MAG: YabP/YqfC family sporulation protein [Oscillospiraceae bacterium]|nr:YabP/YqfC family sporulation protein [Oscillospiraceae bacterium]